MDSQQNKERFHELLLSVNSRKREIQNVYDFLQGTDFFTAPASTRFHGNYEGGLVEHSLEVYRNLGSLYQIYKDRISPTINMDSLIVVALLHDVCKINFYKVGTRNVKDEKGVWQTVPTYTIDDHIPLGHGEKSVIILQQYIQLTADEIYAIRWHMGGFDDAGRSYGGGQALSGAMGICPLLVLLHMSDLAANYITKV